jgi:eukaryotic-like serine/threonine-protein kinase
LEIFVIVEKCPHCDSSDAFNESAEPVVCRCPDCFGLFYVHGDTEPNEFGFLHFDLLEEISQGSNAIVYKAWNRNTSQLCALKLFLSPEFSDGESDFHKEFDFAKSLIHPNIIRVYDGGVHGVTQYIEQELFVGIDLNVYIENQGKMPMEKAFYIGCEVCKGLDYVWSSYLAIHRDIKPHNILMNDSGEIKLCDFGMVNEHGDWFDDLKIEGTPFYLSPESITGDYQDNRSDLYALGVTIFHLISGEPPFDDPSLKKTIYARLDEDPPDIRNFDVNQSEGVAQVLKTMMARDPDERYVTAFECEADLRKVIDGGSPDLIDASRPKVNH